MAKIVIKKRVNLDFLGDEYKEAYLVFNAVPVSEYPELKAKLDKENDNIKLIKIMVGVLQDKFVAGKFPVDGKLEDVTKEDIGSFDEATLTECYLYATGQKLDPKLQGQ